MKRILPAVCFAACLAVVVVLLTGKRLALPFAADAVTEVKLSHYTCVPTGTEEHTVRGREEIAAIWNAVSSSRLRTNHQEPVAGGSVTGICFLLENGTEYPLFYLNVGGELGVLTLPDQTDYQTSANLEALWNSYGSVVGWGETDCKERAE